MPQGSVLGPLFFLAYIYDLPNNVLCEVKLFADDTSLFSVVKDEYDTSLDLNRDLEKNSYLGVAMENAIQCWQNRGNHIFLEKSQIYPSSS